MSDRVVNTTHCRRRLKRVRTQCETHRSRRSMPSPIAVHRALSGVCYPAAKSDLIARAQRNATDSELMNDLEKLPDREYDDYGAVVKDLF